MGANAPLFCFYMIIDGIKILYIKYAIAIAILVVIFLAPMWIGRQTKQNKQYSGCIRIATLLFGWTGIGWLIALFLASKK